MHEIHTNFVRLLEINGIKGAILNSLCHAYIRNMKKATINLIEPFLLRKLFPYSNKIIFQFDLLAYLMTQLDSLDEEQRRELAFKSVVSVRDVLSIAI